MAETLTYKVDFVEVTVPAVRMFDLLQLLGSDLQPLDRGWRGYTSSGLVAGGFGRLGWHEDQDRAAIMGVHLSLGSQALAYLAGRADGWADLDGVRRQVSDLWGNVHDVLRLVRDWGGHVTRLDLAWDDVDEDQAGGLLGLGVMERSLEAGHYTSRWRGGRTVQGWGREKGGHTLYLGSPQSDAVLRCYDKLSERLARGRADQVEGVAHWVRVELQLRRERAAAAARALEDVRKDRGRVARFLAGVLRGYLDFRTPSTTDTNRRRWPVAPWWLSFLGHVEKARLVVERVRRTLDDVRDWLSRSVAPSLALVEAVMGRADGWGWLLAQASAGRARWGPKHRAILAASVGA